MEQHIYTTIVIGAGQAGLSAAAILLRRGLMPGEDMLVLDANDGPGGAWRHRWDSLTFDAAHGIHDLPGMALGTPDPKEPAREVVRRYYGKYEQELELAVLRPVQVDSVTRTRPDEPFTVTAADGRTWRARTLINATGTWDSPYVPYYPGIADFTGRQLHTRGFISPTEFTDRRVLVVGGGTSALQFLLQLDAAGAHTVWVTRSIPRWTERFFDASWGRDVEASVSERTTAGLPPLSVVAATGLPITEQYREGILAGTLVTRGTLRRLTRAGAVLHGPGHDGGAIPTQGALVDALRADPAAAALPPLPGRAIPGDGRPDSELTTSAASDAIPGVLWETPIDDVLWATGFRASLDHLSPLGLRERGGGVTMDEDGVSVVRCPGLFLVGYGASASTIGATRAGRKAAMAAVETAGGTA